MSEPGMTPTSISDRPTDIENDLRQLLVNLPQCLVQYCVVVVAELSSLKKAMGKLEV